MIPTFLKKIMLRLQGQTSDVVAYKDAHPSTAVTPKPAVQKSLAKAEQVIVRIPPSPTGTLHTGTARTALFNYLFAKKHGGKVILRMEDTDTERSKREHEANIIEGLHWLGITWDNETIYRQSERGELYKQHLEQMIAAGTAYISKEAAAEGKRGEVIRFKNPNKTIIFSDVIRGDISFDTTELGDFVIAKSLDEPLYHLAVVVDDLDMGITHIIRGEDHISNTPRQILIQEALGAPRPVYAHLPLLLGEDRSKLSKRHGAKSVNEFKDEGYIAEAIVNYLAFLGWNPGTEQELFTLEELIAAFSLEQCQKGGAVFSEAKLRWFNREYLRQIPEAQLAGLVRGRLAEHGASAELAHALTTVILERIETLGDIDTLIESGELGFFFEAPEYETANLLWKKSEDLGEMRTHLEKVRELIEPLDTFTIESLKGAVWDYATEAGRGNVLWPFRYALSGQDKSPDPFETAEILGKEETLARIDTAVARINHEA
jgi:glutamyl-tRNA synthetase